MVHSMIEQGFDDSLKKKLLLISCSASKRNLRNKPAIEVYDGPVYRILRKYKPPNIDVLILSAKYGLIDSHKSISNYEMKMTKEIAQQIKEPTTRKLTNVLNTHNYHDIHVNLGKTYQLAIDFSELQLKNYNVYFNTGTIGFRLHNLKTWIASEIYSGTPECS